MDKDGGISKRGGIVFFLALFAEKKKGPIPCNKVLVL